MNQYMYLPYNWDFGLGMFARAYTTLFVVFQSDLFMFVVSFLQGQFWAGPEWSRLGDSKRVVHRHPEEDKHPFLLQERRKDVWKSKSWSRCRHHSDETELQRFLPGNYIIALLTVHSCRKYDKFEWQLARSFRGLDTIKTTLKNNTVEIG